MLNIDEIQNGIVIDHIKAGKAMTIYHDLKLDKLDCTVAIIKNARSNKMGKKDIIKTHAEAHNESVNGFINRAIDEAIERDESAPAASEGQGEG